MRWRSWIWGLALLAATPAQAQPHPWPFDFDPQIAADPAGIESRLQQLGAGVPPIPAGDLVGTAVGPVTLYFHADMLDLLEGALASGPGSQQYFRRTPQLCARTAAFAFPSLLVAGASASCTQVEQQARATFSDGGQSCLRIEFPELYVYDQPPGEVDHQQLMNLEGLIRVVGEPLTHIDYPTGLLPASFEPDVRTIIAKIRYPTLINDALARRSAYTSARAQLQANSGCFVSATLAAALTAIDGLIAELDAARTQLEQLYAAGVTQAATDRHAVEAQGRLRNDLPYPALTDHERELLALYLGGLYWRMRGSALLDYPESGLLRRLIYVQYPYQVIADITGGTDGAGLGSDIFVNETWGYADWMDIGHNPGNDKYSDLVDMAKRGKRTLDLAGPHLAQRGYDTAYLYAGGLQMGPCYYYGWDPLWDGTPPRLFQLGENLPDPYMWFLECPTAHGEFCTGAALGVGLARTLLWGKPNPNCVPVCAGRVCGGDGCGGSCGTCATGLECDQGLCVAPGLDAGTTDGGTADGPRDGGQSTDAFGDGSASDTGAPGNGGCACTAARGPAGPGLLLVALAAWWRRRGATPPARGAR